MENRQFIRVNYNAGASLRYGGEVFICDTDNLSLRGIHLSTNQKIPLNVPVQVTIYCSSQSSLKLNATVARKEEHGVGIQITDLSVSSFVQLRNIVSDNANNKNEVFQETYKMLKYIK